MKVQSINNLSFTGIFSDKTAQNDGNWQMEYNPYSWEGKMAPQTDLDIFAEKLPDNEKIFTESNPRKNSWDPKKGRESAKDIFGTEFYYCNYDTKLLRKHITEMPALNREDSLKVHTKKLDAFMSLKQNKMDELEASCENIKNNIESLNKGFNGQLAAYNDSFFSRQQYVNKMKEIHSQEYDKTTKMYSLMKQYIDLKNSSDKVRLLKQKELEEIKFLEEQRNSCNLIDISRRDGFDPNKALWVALQNMKTAVEKYVALPHKTISMKDILSAIGEKAHSQNLTDEIIKYVDKLILKKI